MTGPTTPLLHRDDPDKDPLVGHVKVTRQDWLNMARNVLVTDGIGEHVATHMRLLTRHE